MISGGDNAWSLKRGYFCFTVLKRSSYHSAERNRLVDLPEDLVEPEDVAFGGSDRAVERAEAAPRDADVRVVDVAIDDVGDDARRVLSRADAVGELSEKPRRRRAIQLESLVGRDASSGADLVSKLLDAHQR